MPDFMGFLISAAKNSLYKDFLPGDKGAQLSRFAAPRPRFPSGAAKRYGVISRPS
jgi:hypothetical protein